MSYLLFQVSKPDVYCLTNHFLQAAMSCASHLLFQVSKPDVYCVLQLLFVLPAAFSLSLVPVCLTCSFLCISPVVYCLTCFMDVSPAVFCMSHPFPVCLTSCFCMSYPFPVGLTLHLTCFLCICCFLCLTRFLCLTCHFL